MKPKRTREIAGIIIGSLLVVLCPITAFLYHVFGMMRAFDTLGSPGISDPHRLSSDINVLLYADACGLAGAFIGLIMIFISILCFIRKGRAVSAVQNP